MLKGAGQWGSFSATVVSRVIPWLCYGVIWYFEEKEYQSYLFKVKFCILKQKRMHIRGSSAAFTIVADEIRSKSSREITRDPICQRPVDMFHFRLRRF